MPKLQFAHIEYSIQTRSIDIFSIGCDGFCPGCCNPEIKDWNLAGMSPEHVIQKVHSLYKKFPALIDRILFVGGDPVDAYLHYENEMINFLVTLRFSVPLPIFLFTRYELEQVPEGLQNLVDYVKVGAYIQELTCDNNVQYGIKLATSNQHIIKMS